jgi:hypothetical protein
MKYTFLLFSFLFTASLSFSETVKVRLVQVKEFSKKESCRHIEVQDYDTGKLLDYIHEDDLFNLKELKDISSSILVRNILKVTSQLSVKTLDEVKKYVDGASFETDNICD